MRQISDGDLDAELQVSGRSDEIGVLELSLYNMVAKVKEVVNNIQEGAGHIGLASNQLSMATQQISSGANEQAASVEEISSTTEEIAANIEQNASNAIETQKISALAKVGIDEVTIAAVKSLEATRIIADKISMINDIAFQTNILALNAAV